MTYHRLVCLLINGLTSFVEVDMSVGSHWCLRGLGILHLEPLEQVLHVLRLGDEGAILELLHLEPKEVVHSPIIDISNFCIITLLNSSQDFWLVEPNIMSST
jgi:hypothetical protein